MHGTEPHDPFRARAIPDNDGSGGQPLPARIGVAVLGAGKLGAIHAEHLAQMPGARLVAVADPLLERAQQVGERWGAQVFQDPFEAVRAPQVEAVVIVSATDTHAALIRAAIAERRAVFCEKPLSLDLGQAQTVAAQVLDAGLPFQIGFMRRYDPAYREMKARLAAGEIGEVVALRSISRDPVVPPEAYVAVSGGIFRDQLIHDFDLARFLVGEVTEVFAVGTVRAHPFLRTYGDVEEAMVTLRFTGGEIGQLEGTRASGYGYDIDTELLGTRGALRVQQLEAMPLTLRTRGYVRQPTMPGWIERFRDAYRLELEAFVDGLGQGGQLAPGAADGVAALRVAEAAVRSLAEGRPQEVSAS